MKALAVLFAVIAFLVALATFAPASLLDSRVAAATSGHVRLADASGTLWNGRGSMTNAQRTWSLPVGWTIKPWSIIRGAPAITLQPAEGGDMPRGDITLRDGTIAMDGVAFILPAAMVNGSLAPDSALALGGNLVVDLQHASWSDAGAGGGGAGDGAAIIRWNGARAATAVGNVAMGIVTVNFAPRGGRLVGRVENRGGDVRVAGDIALGNADIDVNLSIAPLPTTPPAIARALGALGTPDGTGAVRLQWRSGPR